MADNGSTQVAEAGKTADQEMPMGANDACASLTSSPVPALSTTFLLMIVIFLFYF